MLSGAASSRQQPPLATSHFHDRRTDVGRPPPSQPRTSVVARAATPAVRAFGPGRAHAHWVRSSFGSARDPSSRRRVTGSLQRTRAPHAHTFHTTPTRRLPRLAARHGLSLARLGRPRPSHWSRDENPPPCARHVDLSFQRVEGPPKTGRPKWQRAIEPTHHRSAPPRGRASQCRRTSRRTWSRRGAKRQCHPQTRPAPRHSPARRRRSRWISGARCVIARGTWRYHRPASRSRWR